MSSLENSLTPVHKEIEKKNPQIHIHSFWLVLKGLIKLHWLAANQIDLQENTVKTRIQSVGSCDQVLYSTCSICVYNKRFTTDLSSLFSVPFFLPAYLSSYSIMLLNGSVIPGIFCVKCDVGVLSQLNT